MNIFTPSFLKRFIFFLFTDTSLFFFSLRFSYELRFDFSIPTEHMAKFYTVFTVLTLLKLVSFYLFGIYRLTWRFFGLDDARRLFNALIIASLAFFILYWFYSSIFLPMPRSVIVIDLILSVVLIGMLRLSKRILLSQFKPSAYKPTLLIGISSDTATLIKSMLESSSNFYPSGIIAVQPKNLNMINSYIGNIKIFRLEDIPSLVDSKRITAAIIDSSLPQELLRESYRKLSDIGIKEIKRSSLLEETPIQELSIEDLLARHPKDLDKSTIQNFIQNKTVLITGAGGSIGSELSEQCYAYGASKLILIDHSEYNLYQIGEKIPSAKLYLANILDKATLTTILSDNRPDIVIHAAAYKHVPLCESNIHAALQNNILGSKNVIDCAISHDVAKIVIISTDKAVRPTNIMGATKRVVELYSQNVDPRNSEIVAVRFGNVLGSSGSVIPKFKAQIDEGGPITLTHPDITRYFMLIEEAVQLVLQASAIAKGGELFILDMGEPNKIIDLARTMIRLYAKSPIEIKTSGLRPGEKLYEELLIDESEQKTAFDSILIAGSTYYPIDQLNDDINTLLQTTYPIETLKKIVPEFTPKP